MSSALQHAVALLKGRRVAVIGDVVADRYVFCEPGRVSREAPVLIVRHQETRVIPGGAANALNNIVALEGIAVPIGVIGDDEAGNALLRHFERTGVDTRGLVRTRNWATIVKTRILAGDLHRTKQQLLRIDYEPSEVPDAAVIGAILERVRSLVPDVDAVLFSDYGYGLVTRPVVDAAITAAPRSIFTADSRYRTLEFGGVTLVTPNESEAEAAVGFRIRDDEALERAGRLLLDRLSGPAVLITRGNKGMALFERQRPRIDVPAIGAEEVADVSGAGDTVIATLTLGLCAGLGAIDAARLANAAASVVVMKIGAATCSPAELSRALGGDA